MRQINRIEISHEDLIHTISYDYYGKRLAVGSSDMKVKVYDYNDNKFTWQLGSNFKAHDSSVLKICWALPTFGQIIATASADRTVRIFEESFETFGYNQINKKWIERAKLGDFRGMVTDLAFSPDDSTLKLAAISTDGYIRFYEAMDVVNLAQWTLMEELFLHSSEQDNVVKDTLIDGYCLSWCSTLFTVSQLVVGCGNDNAVKLISFDSSVNPAKWRVGETVEEFNEPVSSVDWAPNLGRSYELIATSAKDGKVKLFKISDKNQLISDSNSPNDNKLNGLITHLATFTECKREVNCVQFNVTGTILACSGEDGKLRLYQVNKSGEWKCRSVVSSDTSKGISHSKGMSVGFEKHISSPFNGNINFD